MVTRDLWQRKPLCPWAQWVYCHKFLEPYSITIELKKHLQCETLLVLVGESTKKRRNKKLGECISTIRYNVIHMYALAELLVSQ